MLLLLFTIGSQLAFAGTYLEHDEASAGLPCYAEARAGALKCAGQRGAKVVELNRFAVSNIPSQRPAFESWEAEIDKGDELGCFKVKMKPGPECEVDSVEEFTCGE